MRISFFLILTVLCSSCKHIPNKTFLDRPSLNKIGSIFLLQSLHYFEKTPSKYLMNNKPVGISDLKSLERTINDKFRNEMSMNIADFSGLGQSKRIRKFLKKAPEIARGPRRQTTLVMDLLKAGRSVRVFNEDSGDFTGTFSGKEKIGFTRIVFKTLEKDKTFAFSYIDKQRWSLYENYFNTGENFYPARGTYFRSVAVKKTYWSSYGGFNFSTDSRLESVKLDGDSRVISRLGTKYNAFWVASYEIWIDATISDYKGKPILRFFYSTGSIPFYRDGAVNRNNYYKSVAFLLEKFISYIGHVDNERGKSGSRIIAID